MSMSMSMSMSRVILCEDVGDPRTTPRCHVLDPPPGCDPRCGHQGQPDGYLKASRWADEMVETHDQLRCPGCGHWTIWVPSVAGDDLGRGGAT